MNHLRRIYLGNLRVSQAYHFILQCIEKVYYDSENFVISTPDRLRRVGRIRSTKL